jgi:hypothetical protein
MYRMAPARTASHTRESVKYKLSRVIPRERWVRTKPNSLTYLKGQAPLRAAILHRALDLCS